MQVKHIRGILFDDAEKTAKTKTKAQTNSKNQSIHLEIKPVTFLKPAAIITTNKKAKLTQDDSAVTYNVPRIEPNKLVQQKFSVVARSTTNNE